MAGEVFFRKGHMDFDWRRTVSMVAVGQRNWTGRGGRGSIEGIRSFLSTGKGVVEEGKGGEKLRMGRSQIMYCSDCPSVCGDSERP